MTAIIQTISSQKLKGLSQMAGMSIADVHRAVSALVEASNLKGKLTPSYLSVYDHLNGNSEPSATYLMLYKIVLKAESLEDFFE